MFCINSLRFFKSIKHNKFYKTNNIRFNTYSEIKNNRRSNTESLIKFFNNIDSDSLIINTTNIYKTFKGETIINQNKLESNINNEFIRTVYHNGINLDDYLLEHKVKSIYILSIVFMIN